MRLVDLHTEHARRDGTPSSTLVNMFVEPTPQGPRKVMLRGRPGLVRAADPLDSALGTGPVHLVDQFGVFSYILSGNTLYRDGSALSGTLATGNTQQLARSETQLVVVSGGNAYNVDAAVGKITDPDLPQVSSVVYCAGVFVYAELGSGRYYWSEPDNATVIDPLSVATAEAVPDVLVRLETIGDGIIAFGGDSIEYLTPTGNAALPFRRVDGMTQSKGCVAPHSVVRMDNGLFFAGQDGAGRAIYRTDGGIPQRISTPTIDAVLDGASGPDIITTRAFKVLMDGHSFYVVTVPNHGTYAYDAMASHALGKPQWAKWESYDGDPFRITAGDGEIFGDGSGNIFTLSMGAYTDDDDPLVRVCSAFIPAMGTERLNRLRLECATGQDGSVEKRFTNDLVGGYSSWDAVPLGPVGEYGTRAEWWQQGLIANPGRLEEFRFSDDAPFTVYSVALNPPR